jgi:alkylhydroperoxidase/carboxymuconolactone decarboxylase family protein YurZ
MKQENTKKLEESKKVLKEVKEQRGGSLLDFHKQIANIPELLTAFSQQYNICNKDMDQIPRKYKELIIMALGCSQKAKTTIHTHAKLAYENGATIEEIGETLRLVFFLTGITSIIEAADIFEAIELED